jgi:prepilin-type N-terminal cleavage/methylation domain-containing protein
MEILLRQQKRVWAEHGYSLLELLVVLVIIGILATQVVFMLSSADGKVKGAAFNMRSDFNLARGEAVNRNQDVLIDFVFDSDTTYVDASGTRDGYRICVDDDVDSACTGADTIIKDVLFTELVQFYDAAGVNGPTVDINGDAWVVGDGVTFTADNFQMQPNGTSNKAGTIYTYVPNSGDPTDMEAPPYAVVVGSTTGRVRLLRWSLTSTAWTTK